MIINQSLTKGYNMIVKYCAWKQLMISVLLFCSVLGSCVLLEYKLTANEPMADMRAKS